MNIELPELREVSEKLDCVIALLERIAGGDEQQATPGGNAHGRPTRQHMTVAQVAEYIGLAHTTIYKLVLERRIPFVKLGSRLQFEADRIDQWLEKHRVDETGPRSRNRS